jgi:integrase
VEWRTIIAQARYGGLRVPSELLALTWNDVDLTGGKITIRASKTDHESGGVRICPIFPELRPHLEEAYDAAGEKVEHVVARYPDCYANLRTQLLRILARASVKPWPKLFHDLRASRQTELLDRFPIKAVCEWLGNSQPVAPRALRPSDCRAFSGRGQRSDGQPDERRRSRMRSKMLSSKRPHRLGGIRNHDRTIGANLMLRNQLCETMRMLANCV